MNDQVEAAGNALSADANVGVGVALAGAGVSVGEAGGAPLELNTEAANAAREAYEAAHRAEVRASDRKYGGLQIMASLVAANPEAHLGTLANKAVEAVEAYLDRLDR